MMHQDLPRLSLPKTPEKAARPHALPALLKRLLRKASTGPCGTVLAFTAWLFIALFISSVVLTIPSVPVGNEVDLSLSAVLNFAHQHGLQFGTALVSTYGPLGFLIFPCFSPYTGAWRLIIDGVLCLLSVAGLCLVARQLQPRWRWALLVLFTWTAASMDPRTDLLFDTGLFCWGLLSFIESGARLRLSVVVFTLLAGFGALAKVSLLFVGGWSVILLAADLWVRRRKDLALSLTVSFTALFLVGWFVSGQHLGSLGPFLVNAVVVVESYNQALALEGLPLLSRLGLIIGALALVMVIIRAAVAFGWKGRDCVRNFLLLGWALGFAFANWKHGFVHLDAGHALWALGFVPVLALALESLPSAIPATLPWARGCALIVCLLALVTMQWLLFPPVARVLLQPFVNLNYHFQCLSLPSEYEHRMNQELGVLRQRAQLPAMREIIGDAPVDVFGQFQADALYNDLNYVPRPVFQSYSACNARLMRLNEEFYRNKPAAFVMFNLKAMDERFPSLEDARSLRDLLVNCEWVKTEGRYLLLRSKSAEPPRLTLRSEGSVAAGEDIDLSPYGNTNLWIEIDLRPSFIGRMRQWLYRPPTVWLAAKREPKGPLLFRRRAPAAMLNGGFLVSPLLSRNEDVLDFYLHNPVTRPGALSIEMSPADLFLWNVQIHFRIYEIGNLGGAAPAHTDSKPGEVGALPGPSPALVASHPVAPGAAPFNLFRNRRWRPEQPEPGNLNENLTYGLFALMPLVSGGLLLLFVRRRRQAAQPAGFGSLLVGNGLLLFFLLSSSLWGCETWFRFFYDTTDSLGTTRVSERWQQRHWHTNQAGCRDDVEYLPTLQPGLRRVTFLGDSFTAGHGIKNVADRFPNLLRKQHPSWDVHVLANVGLDTGGELALMKKAFSRGYQVQDVVLVYCLNDLGDLLTEQGQAFNGVFAQMAQSPWFARNSYFLNLFYSRFKASRNPFVRDYFSFVRDGYRGPIWAHQQQRLRELRELVQSHGGRLWVVTFPFMQALSPTYEYAFIHEELTRFWQELGVPHLDLLATYKTLRPDQLTVNHYDAHPNERANQLAAAAIGRFLGNG